MTNSGMPSGLAYINCSIVTCITFFLCLQFTRKTHPPAHLLYTCGAIALITHKILLLKVPRIQDKRMKILGMTPILMVILNQSTRLNLNSIIHTLKINVLESSPLNPLIRGFPFLCFSLISFFVNKA